MQKQKADDLIWWVPPNVRGSVLNLETIGLAKVHRCSSAVVVSTTRRESLDPTALGTCRFCMGKLP